MRKLNLIQSIEKAYKLYLEEKITKDQFISILNQKGCVILINSNPAHIKRIWKLKVMIYGLVGYIIIQIITFWILQFKGI
jgi:hypothetical protein